MEKTILHLSDLHFDDKNQKDIKIVFDALLKDLEKLDERIDYIFFNGDIVNRGNNIENYKTVQSEFIDPLLQFTGLSQDEFFLVPGNHEVDRDSINEFIDGNLTDKFADRDKLNNFIDTIDNQKQLLARLDNYHNFISEFHKDNQYLNSKNSLYSTYIIDIGEVKIGLACLNSAWGAFGGDNDYNKILLSERQVDNSLEELKDCNFKICMVHHPLDWLKEFDRESVHVRLITGYDMILTGHVHRQDYQNIAFDNQNTIFLKCPSIFQGRTYNGYNLLKFNFNSNELKVKFREYFDRGRRNFGKAESVADEGEFIFNLTTESNNTLYKDNIDVKKDLRDKAYLDINNKLLSASDSLAPKDINEIFVPPILTTRSENSTKANKEIADDEDVNLDEILESNDNILFIGKKEMGKTTLVNFICNYYLKRHDLSKIPICIDFNELPKGKNIFQKTIQNFLLNYDITDFDINGNLFEGNCILLIDNFNLSNPKNIKKLNEFANEYNSNRFILTMKEDILQTLKIKDLPDFGFSYNTYYINSFRRGQVRQLVKNWFSFKNVNDDEILNNLMSSMKKIGVPKTPMFVSLMLWILEKESNFTPVNEASVIQNFIETLLEKLNPDESKYETIGYKIKIDFLTFLSREMVNESKYYLALNKFEELFVAYFNKKGLEVNSRLKETLFDKGILIKVNDKVYFRFTCFLEFFISLEMNEDREFFNFVTSPKNYLEFPNEIIYYTGLNQKAKSYEVLKIIEGRLLDSFKEIDEIVDINDLASLPVNEIFTKLIKEDNAVPQKIQQLKLSDEDKDVMLDVKEEEDEELGYVKNSQQWIKEEYIYNLELYSNVLKNCELVDLELKLHALKISIEKYCKLTGIIYKSLYEIISDYLLDKENPVDEEITNLITIGIPLTMQTEILKNLGTPKLKMSIEIEIENANTDFEKLMLTCLYGDLRLVGFITKFEELIKNTKSALVREIVTAKLFYYQTFYTMSRFEEEQLVSLLTEIIIETRKIKNPQAKGVIKQQIYKKEIMNQHKKIIE